MKKHHNYRRNLENPKLVPTKQLICNPLDYIEVLQGEKLSWSNRECLSAFEKQPCRLVTTCNYCDSQPPIGLRCNCQGRKSLATPPSTPTPSMKKPHYYLLADLLFIATAIGSSFGLAYGIVFILRLWRHQ